jgi:hypothetical protein
LGVDGGARDAHDGVCGTAFVTGARVKTPWRLAAPADYVREFNLFDACINERNRGLAGHLDLQPQQPGLNALGAEGLAVVQALNDRGIGIAD